MRAAIIPAYNAPFQIRNVQAPFDMSLGADDLRIKMLYASFNPVDWKTRLGYTQKMYPLRQFRDEEEKTTITTGTSSGQQRESQSSFMIGGTDFCGEILEMGSNVRGFAKGDLVCGAHIYAKNFVGTFAEQAIVRADEAVRVPKGFPLDLAGSVGVALVTAYQCFEKFHTGSGTFNRDALQGKSCIIIGASGGVGTFATLLAKHYFGMRVYAVCSESNHEYLIRLGADEAIDYHKVALSEYFAKKPDVEMNQLAGIIDVVGLEEYRKCAVKILGKSGAYVTTVLPTESEEGSYDWSKGFEFVAQQFWKNTLNKLGASCSMHVVMERRDPKLLEMLLQFLLTNNLTDLVERKVVPFDSIQSCATQSECGHVRGKLVLQIASDVSSYGGGFGSKLGQALGGGSIGSSILGGQSSSTTTGFGSRGGQL